MTTDSFETMRNAMVVSQLRPNAVTDLRLLDAMGRVPREDYVPAQYRSTAYADVILPVGGDHAINTPTVTGRLLNEARIGADDVVLIVASASGYVAAVAACLAGSVVSIAAHDVGDAAPPGPFDVIVIDGAVDAVPETLIERLAPDGRLVTGVISAGVTRLAIGRRGGSGFGLSTFADADVVVIPAFARPPAFVF